MSDGFLEHRTLLFQGVVLLFSLMGASGTGIRDVVAQDYRRREESSGLKKFMQIENVTSGSAGLCEDGVGKC
jgi:hypothetical protein